jgi:hypothetical protein
MDAYQIGAELLQQAIEIDYQYGQRYSEESEIMNNCFDCFCYVFNVTWFGCLETLYRVNNLS